MPDQFGRVTAEEVARMQQAQDQFAAQERLKSARANPDTFGEVAPFLFSTTQGRGNMQPNQAPITYNVGGVGYQHDSSTNAPKVVPLPTKEAPQQSNMEAFKEWLKSLFKGDEPVSAREANLPPKGFVYMGTNTAVQPPKR